MLRGKDASPTLKTASPQGLGGFFMPETFRSHARHLPLFEKLRHSG